ncbi:hypothetical protein [Pseudonocardia xinjiangensis]|uniref:Uncharacterized protein n=1 Tax=Pseudonocardia xinjiangensis TaxID=75289 RepID=A0ABX1R6H9_9PSEU|nr:hypothetical protein [Pseudonocardia xinjiangensis]NMH75667.1 hypothetical protein [Pseudonocardia xinjiangensis]
MSPEAASSTSRGITSVTRINASNSPRPRARSRRSGLAGAWRSFKTTAGAVRGGHLILYSATSPEGSGAYLGYQDASTDSFINVSEDGT